MCIQLHAYLFNFCPAVGAPSFPEACASRSPTTSWGTRERTTQPGPLRRGQWENICRGRCAVAYFWQVFGGTDAQTLWKPFFLPCVVVSRDSSRAPLAPILPLSTHTADSSGPHQALRRYWEANLHQNQNKNRRQKPTDLFPYLFLDRQLLFFCPHPLYPKNQQHVAEKIQPHGYPGSC